jgi:hypothetical protein
MWIPYYEHIKILGILFEPSNTQSALKNWIVVTNALRAQVRQVYYRELRLNKRIQYVHTYMLAIAWLPAQVFSLPLDCERQINTAILWFLWRGTF